MSKPIKVLTLNVSDSSGGAARAAYRIHKSIQSLGLDAKMLVKHKALKDESVIEISDFDTSFLFRKPFRFLSNKFKNKFQQYQWGKYPNRDDVFMSDLRSVSFNGALQKIEFDILHLHWINLRFLDLRELVKLNKPIVWTLHDCWPFTGICHYCYDCDRYKSMCGDCPFLHSMVESDLSELVWKKKKAIYSKLNLHIVSPSKWLGKLAAQSSLFSNFPVYIIPNCITTDVYTPGSKLNARKELNLNADKKYILFGAMNAINDKRKGFVEFQKTLKILAQNDLDSNMELLVVGADEPIVELKNYLSTTYLGVIHSDQLMVSVYQSVDLVVVPSLSENLSNAIMESLSCGTPVVAFDVGGNSDMIKHKQNGYLAKSYLSDDLAEGVKWCLDNNFEDCLSIHARNEVLNTFTMEKIGEKYVELFQSIIKNK